MGKAFTFIFTIVLAAVLAAFIFALVVGLIMAVPMYFLWNALMPDLFHLREITFLQAWGLCWLCGLLFKSSSTCTCKAEK